MPEGEMHMRELRFTGEPNEPHLAASLDLLPDGHPDTMLFEMAILSLPTVTMIDHHAVATFTTGDCLSRWCIRQPHVWRTIANTLNRAGGRGDNRHPALHDTSIPNGKVHPIMAVIRSRMALKILRRLPGIDIDIIDDPTGFTQPTVCGKVQRNGIGLVQSELVSSRGHLNQSDDCDDGGGSEKEGHGNDTFTDEADAAWALHRVGVHR
jgi:hypothetical protein